MPKERSARYRERKRDQGLVQATIWLRPDDVEHFQRLAQIVRENPEWWVLPAHTGSEIAHDYIMGLRSPNAPA